MIAFPHAKINLGLHVLSQEAGPDAFHQVESLLLPVAVHDILEIVEAPDGKTRLFTSGLPLPAEPHAKTEPEAVPCDKAGKSRDGMPPGHETTGKTDAPFKAVNGPVSKGEPREIAGDESPCHLPGRRGKHTSHNNLCLRALEITNQALSKGSPPLPPLHIHLHKQIPVGGGLGGGSANGTFTLSLLQRMFSLGFTGELMHRLASRLGSDCPFFLHREPMLASGRGERLEAFPIPNIQECQIVIITPPIHISTKEAYSLVKPRKGRRPLKEILSRGIRHWQQALANDFEEPLFAAYPILPQIKARLLEKGAAYASLSGSGSSVYGLFVSKPPLNELERDFSSSRIIRTKVLA